MGGGKALDTSERSHPTGVCPSKQTHDSSARYARGVQGANLLFGINHAG